MTGSSEESKKSSLIEGKKEENQNPSESKSYYLPFKKFNRKQALLPYKDKSQLHPLLSDFEEVAKNPRSTFPYKWMVYGGNHWETLIAVARPRGFTLVFKNSFDKKGSNKRRRSSGEYGFYMEAKSIFK